jgi:hypothetical protein
MLPRDAARPPGKNNIDLATHARSISERRSSRKHSDRGSASVPVLIHCEEPLSVDMVGHEAISDERHSAEAYVLPQQAKVNRSIGIAVQDEAPPAPALRHMVWHINGNHPSESSHDTSPAASIFTPAYRTLRRPLAQPSTKMNER